MTDADIDNIYDTANLLMENERFPLIDDILDYYANLAWRLDTDLLMSWATVTLPIKSKLKNRSRFLVECSKFHLDPNEPNLWKGLK